MFIISHSTDHLESSMGAATALYSATFFAHGKYGNGNPYPINLRAFVGLSGWLPGSRPNWEGGQYDGDEKSRLNVLQLAIELGADYIDVELQEFSSSSEGRCCEQFIFRSERKNERPCIRLCWGNLLLAEQVSQLQMHLAVAQAEILCFYQLHKQFGDKCHFAHGECMGTWQANSSIP